MNSNSGNSETAQGPAGSPRSLREAWPRFASHRSPRLLLASLATALLVRIGLGGFSGWDAVAVAALVALWPVQEWLIHVLILHFRPRRMPAALGGRVIDFRVPRSHRAHHRDPWRPDLVFIPFHSFLYSIPLMALVWFALAPTPALAMTGVVCHVALALHYEAVHFLIHTRVTPQGAYYRRLWQNHRLHHFRNEHYWFGVTMLSGDRLLGTAPEPDRVTLSPTARDLHAA